MDDPLGAFLDHARSKGMDHATIRMLLLSAGWKEKEIARALTEHSLDMLKVATVFVAAGSCASSTHAAWKTCGRSTARC
jgi:hypothetical protein